MGTRAGPVAAESGGRIGLAAAEGGARAQRGLRWVGCGGVSGKRGAGGDGDGVRKVDMPAAPRRVRERERGHGRSQRRAGFAYQNRTCERSSEPRFNYIGKTTGQSAYQNAACERFIHNRDFGTSFSFIARNLERERAALLQPGRHRGSTSPPRAPRAPSQPVVRQTVVHAPPTHIHQTTFRKPAARPPPTNRPHPCRTTCHHPSTPSLTCAFEPPCRTPSQRGKNRTRSRTASRKVVVATS